MMTQNDKEDGRYEMQGKSAIDPDPHGPRAVVLGRRGADTHPALTPVVASDYRAVAPVTADGR